MAERTTVTMGWDVGDTFTDICALAPDFKRVTYLVARAPENLALARKRVVVHEREDGRVEIHCDGRQLPYSILEYNPVVIQGVVVENKRLGTVLSLIQGAQTERDRARLAAKNVTKRRTASSRRERPRGSPRCQRPCHPGRRGGWTRCSPI